MATLRPKDLADLLEAATRCPLCSIELTDDRLRPTSKEIDHVIPIEDGGSHTPENVRVICMRCNRTRSARPCSGCGRSFPHDRERCRRDRARAERGAEIRARAARATAMHRAGATWAQVAEQLGYSSAATAAAHAKQYGGHRSELRYGAAVLERVHELRSCGHGYKAIARELGVSRDTARELVRRAARGASTRP